MSAAAAQDRVLGIDVSGPKLALGYYGADGNLDWATFACQRRGPSRLVYWRQAIHDRPHLFDDVVTVIVEIPWAAARSSWTLLSIAGVVVEACAATCGAPVMEMSTGTWKKLSVGHGNAMKPQVLEHAQKLGYTGTDQDVADALCMAQAGWKRYEDRRQAA